VVVCFGGGSVAVVVVIEGGGSSLLGRVVVTGERVVVVSPGSCVTFVSREALVLCFEAPEQPTRRIAAAGIAAAMKHGPIDHPPI
jgi:hypothetical protein